MEEGGEGGPPGGGGFELGGVAAAGEDVEGFGLIGGRAAGPSSEPPFGMTREEAERALGGAISSDE